MVYLKYELKNSWENMKPSPRKKTAKHSKGSSSYKITLKVNKVQVKRETDIFQQRKKYIFNRKKKSLANSFLFLELGIMLNGKNVQASASWRNIVLSAATNIYSTYFKFLL